IFAAGQFLFIAGTSRHGLAELDPTTGGATPWDPALHGGGVSALALSGTKLFVGGAFTAVGPNARAGIAAVHIRPGHAPPRNPSPDGPVNALAVDGAGSVVYAGGSFLGIGGAARRGVAALDATSALATNWNALCDGRVKSLSLAGNVLVLGGIFTSVGALQ